MQRARSASDHRAGADLHGGVAVCVIRGRTVIGHGGRRGGGRGRGGEHDGRMQRTGGAGDHRPGAYRHGRIAAGQRGG